MEDVIDLIANNGSASDVSSKMKDLLYTKSAEKVEALRPGFSKESWITQNLVEEQFLFAWLMNSTFLNQLSIARLEI